MKDVIHHRKHTQKKVIQSVRKAQQVESNPLAPVAESWQKNKNKNFKATS